MNRIIRIRLPVLLAAAAVLLIAAPLVGMWILGSGYFVSSTAGNAGELARFRSAVTVVAVAQPLILFLVFAAFRHNVFGPLERLSARARSFTGGEVDFTEMSGEAYPAVEIDSLAKSMNDMIRAAVKKDRDLCGENGAPEPKPRRGRQVSGTALTISTPLSVGITASSFLRERAGTIKKDWDSQALTEYDLEQFLQDSEESSRIIQEQLEQTVRIVNGLTLAAADGPDVLQEFELGARLKELILDIWQQLRLRRNTISVRVDGPVTVITYPGAVERILSNLVFDSVARGFGESAGEEIEIRLRLEEKEVVMEYNDPGTASKSPEPHRVVKGKDGSAGLGAVLSTVRDRLGGDAAINPPGIVLRFPANTKEVYD